MKIIEAFTDFREISWVVDLKLVEAFVLAIRLLFYSINV